MSRSEWLHNQESEWISRDAADTHSGHSGSGLELDESKRTASWCGRELRINPKTDYTLLETLVNACGNLVRHADLLRAIRPGLIHDHANTTETSGEVKDSLGRIRKALRDAGCTLSIRSAKGIGYRLVIPSD